MDHVRSIFGEIIKLSATEMSQNNFYITSKCKKFEVFCSEGNNETSITFLMYQMIQNKSGEVRFRNM